MQHQMEEWEDLNVRSERQDPEEHEEADLKLVGDKWMFDEGFMW